MTNYRRLISYIYAYEGEVKGKNIGFAKLESRNGQCKLSVNVKKVYVGSSDLGVYLLAPGKEIFLGNIFIRGGSGEFRAAISVENAADSGRSLDECYGLTIHEPEDAWRAYTTIWEDAVAHAAEVELADVTSGKVGNTETQIHKKVEELAREINDGADPSGKMTESAETDSDRTADLETLVFSASGPMTEVNLDDGDGDVEQKLDMDQKPDMVQVSDADQEPDADWGPDSNRGLDVDREPDADRDPDADWESDADRGLDVDREPDADRNPDADREPDTDQGLHMAQNPDINQTSEEMQPSAQWLEPGSQADVNAEPDQTAYPIMEQPITEQPIMEQPSDADMFPKAESHTDIQGQSDETAQYDMESPQDSEIQPPIEEQPVNEPSEPYQQQWDTTYNSRQMPMEMPYRMNRNTQSGMPFRRNTQFPAGMPLRGNAQTPAGISSRGNAQTPASMPTRGNAPSPATMLTRGTTQPPAPMLPESNPQPGRGIQSRPNRYFRKEMIPQPVMIPENAAPPSPVPQEEYAVPAENTAEKKVPVIDSGSEEEIALGNPQDLQRLEQEEQENAGPFMLWEKFRKQYPKIQAFDSANGCEILTIKPQDIGLLPRENWNYGNNSFLLHGYYNYRYLILARIGDESQGRTRYILGVPGHYYSNEKYMASMFGFPHFVLSKKQPSQDGRFGYWYTDVRMENQD